MQTSKERFETERSTVS